MNILGIYPQGPNTASALLVDGACVAFVEEERFTRQKLATDTIPTRSSAFCLSHAGLTLDDVSAVTVGWNNELYRSVMPEFFRTRMSHAEKDEYSRLYETLSLTAKHPTYFDKRLAIAYRRSGIPGAFPPHHYYQHHLCHAYSVFYPSPFDRALIVVVDGSGEQMATSVWVGEGTDLRLLTSIDIPHSLGFFYAAVTEYLGFSVFTGEGKVMGLASYGGPDPEIGRKLDQVLWLEEDAYRVDPQYLYYSPRNQSFRHTDRLTELLGRPPRTPESALEPWHKNLAWELQHKLESVIEHVIRRAIAQTGLRDVCLSGGVAMNCKMNGFVSTLDVVSRCFVIPASTDAGCSYGSALLHAAQRGLPDLRLKAQGLSPYLGPEYSDVEVDAALRESKMVSGIRKIASEDDLVTEVAERLARGELVGWFQGRMEVGARALGNRSILANPSLPNIKDRLNREVKRREGFRPFAPSILAERASEVFSLQGNEQYEPYHSWMLKAVSVSPSVQQQLSAVVHVDGTIRPQVVSSASNPRYHRLIDAFWRRTGVPAVLNTSFNVRGEPIVCTPLDAVRCFYSTGLDACAIGNYLLTKE